MTNSRYVRMCAYLAFALAGLGTWVFVLSQLIAGFDVNQDALRGLLPGSSLANGIAADLLIAGLTFVIWAFHEAHSLSMRHPWVYVAIFFTTPIAFFAPFFFFMRERRLARLGWD